MMWERLSALEGGTVSGLTVVRDAGGRPVVFAVTPTGLSRSEDGGRSWSAVGRERALPLAQQIVASPDYARDSTLFSAAHDGLYRSEDGGRHWRLVLIGEILAVALSPRFADDHLVFVGTAEDGVLRSEDGGADWGGANPGLLDLAALTVALSPRFSEDRTAFVGTATALYRSRNGGRSWREVDLGLNEPAIQVLALSPRFDEDKLALVGTEADGLLRSDDGGASFEAVPELAGRGVSALTIAPNGQTIVAAAGTEAFRSDDGGRSWRPLPEAPSLILSLALVPGEGDEVVLAGLYREGVARVADGGGWVSCRSGLHARLLTSLLPSPTFAQDNTLFMTSIDDGVLVSRDGGRSWDTSWPEDADPGVTALAVSSRYASDRLLLASTADGLYRSADGGASWESLAAPAPPLRILSPLPMSDAAGFLGVTLAPPPLPLAGEGVGGRGPQRRGGGTLPANALAISNDGGRSWRQLDGRGLGNRAALGALAASPAYSQDRMLFAGGAEARSDGAVVTRVMRSTDGGRSWSIWLEDLGQGGALLAGGLLVPASFPRDGNVIVAVGGRILTPAPNTWERRSGQRRPAWHAAEPGREVVSVTVLAAPSDPEAGPIVYAGTNVGPSVSRDGGRSFEPWAEGYDGGGVVGLAASPAFTSDRLVFAVGLGGTIWQRTDTT